MPRQSISFTPPSDQWLKAQVESQEFSNNSDVVNDLIRVARERQTIRLRLIHAEQSGFTDLGRDKILNEAKEWTGRGKL